MNNNTNFERPNFWMYSDTPQQREAANSLTVFGADVFKRAKIINEMAYLQEYIDGRKKGTASPQDPKIVEYVLEYLIDCIKVLIFFENYMKAELILADYCVHQIDWKASGFKELAGKQKDKPIKLSEIAEIEPFEVNLLNNTIFHRAIKDTTIGMYVLTNNQAYTKHYKFDQEVLEIVRELTKVRNQLHFRDTVEMVLSQKTIDRFKKLDDFVMELFNNGSEIASS